MSTRSMVIEAEPPPHVAKRAASVVVVDAADLLKTEFPPRTTLLAPWLQSQSLTMIYAWRGTGKTHVSLGVAFAVSSGGSFLGWKADKPEPVLFIDGEMPGVALQDRVARLIDSADAQPPPDYLRFITPDLQRGGVPNLATREGQDAIGAVLGDAKLIVLDNLSCLARGGRENDAESWQPVADWALRMRTESRSVLFVHHSGKGGQQRGTSKREDLLDTVISLSRPSDYQPEQGARFVVQFDKARALHGQDVEAFEAALVADARGRQAWAMKSAAVAADAQMIELAQMGMTQTDIAGELGVNKSTVCRALKKAEDEGRYKPAKGGRHG